MYFEYLSETINIHASFDEPNFETISVRIFNATRLLSFAFLPIIFPALYFYILCKSIAIVLYYRSFQILINWLMTDFKDAMEWWCDTCPKINVLTGFARLKTAASGAMFAAAAEALDEIDAAEENIEVKLNVFSERTSMFSAQKVFGNNEHSFANCL
jgi:hypothetical protein